MRNNLMGIPRSFALTLVVWLSLFSNKAWSDQWTGPMRIHQVVVSQDANVVRLITEQNSEAKDIANGAGLNCNHTRGDQNGVVVIELGEDGANDASLQQMLTIVNLAIVTYRFVHLRISEDHCSFVETTDGIPVTNGVRLLRD